MKQEEIILETRNKIYNSLSSVLSIADKIDLNIDAACNIMRKLGFPNGCGIYSSEIRSLVKNTLILIEQMEDLREDYRIAKAVLDVRCKFLRDVFGREDVVGVSDEEKERIKKLVREIFANDADCK